MVKDQYETVFLNPDTDKFTLSESFKQVLELINDIYSIPGNRPATSAIVAPEEFQNGTTAMVLGYHTDPIQTAADPSDIDMVTFPVIDKSSTVGAGSRSTTLVITQQSDNKELAFDVINYLVSEQVQTSNNADGYGTVLVNPAFEENFGENLVQFQDKNVSALIGQDIPELPPSSSYEWIAYAAAVPYLQMIITGERSMEEIIDEMEQAVNAVVESEKIRASQL